MNDPHQVRVAATELSRLADALDVVSRHAELNHRYRALIEDSQRILGGPDMRLTQARGIAKKLLVLVKAAGPDFRANLGTEDHAALDAGLAQAGELVQSPS